MKLRIFPITTLLILLTLPGWSGNLIAPDFTLAIHIKGSQVEAVATPPAGNHINMEAPAFLKLDGSDEKIKPAERTPSRASFKFQASGKHAFVVSLYLCDEKKTYCEKHEVSGAVEGADPGASKTKSPAPQPLKKKPAEPRANAARKEALAMKGDFILNQPEEALRLARERNKPLLIDFFAIWCPPCNMLDSDIFHHAEFRKAAEDFILLKLDVDSSVSWNLRSRYQIGAYPTVIFASSAGDEISRIVGYRKKADFLRELTTAWKFRDSPVIKMTEKANQGDLTAAERLGILHLERKEYAEAIRWLSKVPARQEEKLSAELALLEKQGKKDELLELLQTANRNFPETLPSLERRQKLAEILAERKSPELNGTLKQLIEISRKFITEPKLLEGKDYTPADLLGIIADAQEQLGETESARKTWALAASEYEKEIPRTGPLERGRNSERAYCLWHSGQTEAADRLYQELKKAYPEEFTFYHAHASMKFHLKQLEEAEKLAALSWKNSYGDNRLRTTLLYAKILKAEKKEEQAGKIISETLLGAQNAPQDPSIRTHKYIQALKDFQKTL